VRHPGYRAIDYAKRSAAATPTVLYESVFADTNGTVAELDEVVRATASGSIEMR
jgi:hypothetical protein